jgi:hypothetical protein
MPLPDPTLSQAFQRASANPVFVGYRLAQLRQDESLTPQQQAAALGNSLDSLAGLCLCPQPKQLADVQRIAARMPPAFCATPWRTCHRRK